MNLFALINRGVRLSEASEVDRLSEQARKRWIDALTTDEIRTWMNVQQQDKASLVGLGLVLSGAALAAQHDAKTGDTPDTPDVRVIRGALSAIEQAGHNGSLIDAPTAQAISSAATRAREVLQRCSKDAIQHAARELRRAVGLTATHA